MLSHFHNRLDNAVSRDGRVAIDYGPVNPSQRDQALMWTASGGTRPLGRLPGDLTSEPTGLNANGSVVVGFSTSSFPDNYRNHAFRWTASTGMQALGFLPGHNVSASHAVSGNGAVVIGSSGLRPTVFDVAEEDVRLFRWTQGGGMQEFAAPSWATRITANTLNYTGSVIAGTFQTELPFGTPGFAGAYVWNAGTFQTLPMLPGTGAATASTSAMNDPGDIIVGTCATMSSFDGVPVMWRRDLLTGGWSVESLSSGVRENRFYPHGVSRDGGVVVGNAFDYRNWSVATVWTPVYGTVNLNVVLPQMGIDLSGWYLTSATAVSPDGTQISGVGYGPGGVSTWTITVPMAIPAPSVAGLAGCAALLAGKRRRAALLAGKRRRAACSH